nr:methyltransferase domain-containing protein [Frankia sp. QA3]
MLELLDLRDGMAVLKVGTGTGYNAASLAERTPSGAVTSVEINPGIAERAQVALARSGWPVRASSVTGRRGVRTERPRNSTRPCRSACPDRRAGHARGRARP